MRFTTTTLAALVLAVFAAPSATLKEQSRDAVAACSSAVSLDAKTNVFQNYTLHANSFYRAELEAAAANMQGTLKQQALRVADVVSFVWMLVTLRDPRPPAWVPNHTRV